MVVIIMIFTETSSTSESKTVKKQKVLKES